MKRSIAPLALLVLALAPATATAAVRCVPAAAPGCASNHPTIDAAVTAAANDDTIRIAAGTYNEAVNTTKRLIFAGAGGGTIESDAGATVIAPASSLPFNLPAGGTLRSLRAVGPSGFIGTTALAFMPTVNGSYAYTLDDVVAIGGTGTDFTIGFGGYGLSVSSSDPAKVVQLDVTDSEFKAGSSTSFFAGYGVSISGAALTTSIARSRVLGADSGGSSALVSSGGPIEISESTLRGGTAAQLYEGSATIRRSRVEGVGGLASVGAGIVVLDQTTTTPATQLTVVDSLVTSTPSVDGFAAYPLVVQTFDTGNAATATVRGSTLVGRGIDPDAAVAAIRQTSASPAATVDLRNSVARLEGPAEAGEGDLLADRGTIAAASSSFSSAATANGGTVTAPGAGTNVAGDPRLGADFAPIAVSPLIDRGDPALIAPGQLDLLGRPRSQDGNGDCLARPDIGAFELPSRCPVVPASNARPEISALSLLRKRFTARKPRTKGRKRGTAFRLTLSEAARLRLVFERRTSGRRVKVKGKRRCVRRTPKNAKKPKCTRWVKAGSLTTDGKAGANVIAFSGKLRGKPLKPGPYRAKVVAIDAAALRSATRTIRFRVLRP